MAEGKPSPKGRKPKRALLGFANVAAAIFASITSRFCMCQSTVKYDSELEEQQQQAAEAHSTALSRDAPCAPAATPSPTRPTSTLSAHDVKAAHKPSPNVSSLNNSPAGKAGPASAPSRTLRPAPAPAPAPAPSQAPPPPPTRVKFADTPNSMADDVLYNCNLERQRIKGDGYCMYRAIAYSLGLNAPQDYLRLAVLLRSYLVKFMYMLSHMAGMLESAACLYGMLKYVRDSYWGIEADMYVAATVLNVNIGVLYDDGRFTCYFPMLGWPAAAVSALFGNRIDVSENKTILLVYSNSASHTAAHYDAVRLPTAAANQLGLPKHSYAYANYQKQYIASVVSNLQEWQNKSTLQEAKQAAQESAARGLYAYPDCAFEDAAALRGKLLQGLPISDPVVVDAIKHNQRDSIKAALDRAFGKHLTHDPTSVALEKATADSMKTGAADEARRQLQQAAAAATAKLYDSSAAMVVDDKEPHGRRLSNGSDQGGPPVLSPQTSGAMSD